MPLEFQNSYNTLMGNSADLYFQDQYNSLESQYEEEDTLASGPGGFQNFTDNAGVFVEKVLDPLSNIAFNFLTLKQRPYPTYTSPYKPTYQNWIMWALVLAVLAFLAWLLFFRK